jgi:DNA-binding CsgD family transcriptional regulator
MQKSVDIYTEIIESKSLDNHPDYKKHYHKLKEVDSFLPPSDSFLLLLNNEKISYEFISRNFEYILGFPVERMLNEGAKFWFSLIHPDDLKIWLKIIDDLIQFTINKVDPKNRSRLIYIYNFRVKNSKGKYINLHSHLNPLEFGKNGKPVIGLSHYSVIPVKRTRPMIGVVKILNENDIYETLYYKNYTHKNIDDQLTKRERDIIRLMAAGHRSKEMGEELFISSHTVDKHRRNILKKLNFKSTGEVIQYCKENPLF